MVNAKYSTHHLAQSKRIVTKMYCYVLFLIYVLNMTTGFLKVPFFFSIFHGLYVFPFFCWQRLFLQGYTLPEKIPYSISVCEL